MAITATPAKASGDLIDRLVAASWSRSTNELELAAIARDANALMRVDAASAHMVLGSVAAVRGNSRDTKHHYGVALRLNQHPYTVRRNYSVALATTIVVGRWPNLPVSPYPNAAASTRGSSKL